MWIVVFGIRVVYISVKGVGKMLVMGRGMNDATRSIISRTLSSLQPSQSLPPISKQPKPLSLRLLEYLFSHYGLCHARRAVAVLQL